MARATVIHSDDAVQINFYGNPRKPEPTTAVIKFPRGHVEVSRCSDGTYWAHVHTVAPCNVVASRIDYDHEGAIGHGIPAIPAADRIQHLAVRIANTMAHADWEAA